MLRTGFPSSLACLKHNQLDMCQNWVAPSPKTRRLRQYSLASSSPGLEFVQLLARNQSHSPHMTECLCEAILHSFSNHYTVSVEAMRSFLSGNHQRHLIAHRQQFGLPAEGIHTHKLDCMSRSKQCHLFVWYLARFTAWTACKHLQPTRPHPEMLGSSI